MYSTHVRTYIRTHVWYCMVPGPTGPHGSLRLPAEGAGLCWRRAGRVAAAAEPGRRWRRRQVPFFTPTPLLLPVFYSL